MTDIPPVGSRDILVRVKACSICGTDRHIYNWDQWAANRIVPPLIVGHELAGEVVEVGRDTTLVKVGDFISADSHVADYPCPVCRNGQPHICSNLKILGIDTRGVFADYAVIPEEIAWKNDPTLEPGLAAVQEPLGNAVYATLAEPVSGRTVAVFGDGPTGCGAVGTAKAAGAAVVYHIGKHPFRLDIGRKMGADVSFNITEPNTDVVQSILDATDGVGVDVVLEMTGSEKAIRDGLTVLRKGGRFSAFGIPSGPIQMDFAEGVIMKGIRVLGINGRLMWETWFQMAGLIKAGKLDPSPIITHRISLEEYEDGFRAMNAPDRRVCKVVMYPDPKDIP